LRTHRQIEERSLELARAIAARIDADPSRSGLARAREVCARWRRMGRAAGVEEWARILEGSWDEVKEALLDPSETGRRLRQSSPFCGVLSPRERWAVWRRFRAA
jgi:hypothetical protein